MKKAAIGMLVVLTLTLGSATRGESAKVLGCITQFSNWVRSNGQLILRVEVGNKWWTAPGLLDTRVRVFDLMRPPQLERVFPALPGPAFGSRSPRESNDGYTGS